MTFEPTLVGATWLCPCTDAYGQSAHLVEAASFHKPTDTTEDGRTVENFHCDQNGDVWQKVTDVAGGFAWQYLGRQGALAL